VRGYALCSNSVSVWKAGMAGVNSSCGWGGAEGSHMRRRAVFWDVDQGLDRGAQGRGGLSGHLGLRTRVRWSACGQLQPLPDLSSFPRCYCFTHHLTTMWTQRISRTSAGACHYCRCPILSPPFILHAPNRRHLRILMCTTVPAIIVTHAYPQLA